MTSTKVFYVIAAIVPFGFVVLAAAAVVHSLYARRKSVQITAR